MSVLQSSDDDFRSVMASVDKDGHRRWLHVHLNGGFWRWCRVLVASALIAFYLALPFLTVGGNPFLRIDIPHRHYIIAGHVFWPQDFYYLLLFLLIGAFGTLLMVALVGRFYCGWLCPHSVFLEMVYRPLERLIQGSAARRARAQREGRDRFRKQLTWLAFILTSGILANTATAIFVGTDAFIGGLLIDPIHHPAAAIFFVLGFSIILVNFAWFREQMCTIVCPYGRIQSVMLDPHSLVVAYNKSRGEPRGKPGAVVGDCIDCYQCVAVCPTGIDIRNGSQLECIHCAACVDACNSVMVKLQKRPGLIDYSSEIGLSDGRRRILRVRVFFYATAMVTALSFTIWSLSHRDTLVASRLRTTVPAVMIDQSDGQKMIRQLVPLSLVNRSDEPIVCTLELPPELGASILLAQPCITIEANARIEITPVVDIPAPRFQSGTLSTELRVKQFRQTMILPITLHSP